MKKLLSFLGVVAIGIAPAVTVIACGPNNNSSDEDNNLVIENGFMVLDADDILTILEGEYGPEGIFGTEKDKVLNQFMKVFSYGFTKEVHEELNSDGTNNPDQPKLKDLEENTKSSYVNDNFMENIDQKYTIFENDVKEEWNEKVKAAQKNDDYKSDFDKKFREALEKEFNKKHDKWQDYETDFKLRKIVTDSDSINPSQILSQEIIENFASGVGYETTSQAISDVSRDLFNIPDLKVGGFEINFTSDANSVTLPEGQINDPTSRARSWFGQFDNFLKGLKALSTSTNQDDINAYNNLVVYLIKMINATGGLGLEDSLKEGIKTLTIKDVKWATLNNIRSEILEKDDAALQSWSNKLLKRMDSKYEEHFGKDVQAGQIIAGKAGNLTANGEIPELKVKYRDLFKTTPDFSTPVLVGGEEKKGLISNSKRYFTDLYYQQKKPVAVTEFVVTPWESGNNVTNFKDEINSAPYISATNGKYIGLYNFINVFVNSAISGNTGSNDLKDQTREMFDGESDYSWDVLLNNKGTLKGISHKGTENNSDSWIPSDALWNGMEENLKPVDHKADGLLTIDSNKYNDTLKYAVYDFLQTANPSEYNSWDTDNRPSYNHDTDINTLLQENQKYAKSIAGLIHSLDRSGQANATEKGHDNVYQILNAKQGILAYTADDGIHFVRVEGYPLLNNEADLLSEQKQLTAKTDDFNTTFATYEQYGTNNNADSKEAEKTANSLIVTDYLNRNLDAQNLAKIRYQDLNNTFGNKYLEFLINASIPTTIEALKSKYDFDLNKDVQQWVTSNSHDREHYWIGIWDYLKEIFGIKSDGELFDMFFSLADPNNAESKLLKDYKKNILEALNIFRKTESTTGKNFSTGWYSYEQKNENIVADHAQFQYTPWNYTASWEKTPGDRAKMINIVSSKKWQYDNQVASQMTYNYEINLMNYLVWNQQTQVSILNEGKVA